MKVYIGADHRGFNAAQKLVSYVRSLGYEIANESEKEINPEDDYPVIAQRVVRHLLSGNENDAIGILICGSGQGMCMTANRYKNIRAALCYDDASARSARNDDDANIICLPSVIAESEAAADIISTFLKTPFAAAPRYVRRIREMDDL